PSRGAGPRRLPPREPDAERGGLDDGLPVVPRNGGGPRRPPGGDAGRGPRVGIRLRVRRTLPRERMAPGLASLPASLPSRPAHSPDRSSVGTGGGGDRLSPPDPEGRRLAHGSRLL